MKLPLLLLVLLLPACVRYSDQGWTVPPDPYAQAGACAVVAPIAWPITAPAAGVILLTSVVIPSDREMPKPVRMVDGKLVQVQ